MATLNEIKDVIRKIISVDELREHICFFGGATPYLICNKESGRDHSDIDVLVDEEYMDLVRELLRANNLYNPERDSLNLNLGEDYGVKCFINGIYVEFEPMRVEDNRFIRKSFSPRRNLAGSEEIMFEDISDIIIPIELDGKKVYAETMELIKVDKETYQREKDIKDIEFINDNGVNEEKYQRVQKANMNKVTKMISYSQENTK